MDRGLIAFLIVGGLSLAAVWTMLSRPPRKFDLSQDTPIDPVSRWQPSPTAIGLRETPSVLAPQILPSSETESTDLKDAIPLPQTDLLTSFRQIRPPHLPEEFPDKLHAAAQQFYDGAYANSPETRYRSPAAAIDPVATPRRGPRTGTPPIVRRHRIQDGDTLPALANRYYGDPTRWSIIYEANRSAIEDPDLLPVGIEIIIPVQP